MPKRIVIGIGGTGLEVIRSLRRRIVESYPNQGLNHFPSVGFLYLDTDEKEIKRIEDNRKRWEVLGKSILLRESEFHMLKAPAVGRVLDDLESYPQLRDWLPVEQLSGLDVAARDTPGAQQNRVLGRLIFTLTCDEIKQQFTNALNSLPEDPAGGAPEVIVACSLSGGTGGGMFLDLAYSLRRWLQGRGSTTAFLVLPDLMEEAARGRRYLANAYAALMDLNYFSLRAREVEGRPAPVAFHLPTENARSRDNPFDFCYLVSTRNQMAEGVTLEAVNDMVAHRILLALDSAISGEIGSMMNNGADERTKYPTDPKNGNVFAQAFSTFGLATVQYPTEQITEILALRLVEHAIRGWLQPPPVDNVNQRLQGQMPSLLLTDEHLAGNRDFFGQGQDYLPIPADVERLLTEKLVATPRTNRAPYLNQVFAGFLEEFRGGLPRFYRTLSDNLDGAADVVVRKARAEISNALADPALGYPYALAAVDELIRLMQVKRQAFESEKQKLSARIRGSATMKTAAIGEVSRAEGKLMFREAAVKEAMDKVKAAMVMNFTAQVQDRSFEFGMTLADAIVARLKILRTEAIEWANYFANLKAELDKEVEGRARTLGDLQKNRSRFNGIVLFRMERVQQLYEQFQHEEAALFIRNQFLTRKPAIDWRIDIAETQRELFGAAVEWMATRSTVKVTGKNVAQQLLEDYPGPNNPERHDIISRAFRRSAPFLEFDKGETAIYRDQEGHGYSADPRTRVYRAALMDHDQNRRREVVQIRDEIVSATRLTPDKIGIISETQQIVFMSELTAFPLRVIKDMAVLRDRYRAHTRERKALPLHVQKAFDPPMGDLLLVSEGELQQRYRLEEEFLLGWTLGHQPEERDWLREEMNPYEQRTEVRFRFTEAGASDFQRVADNRDEAFRAWTGDRQELDGARQKLHNALERYLQKIVDVRHRQQLADKLHAALSAIRADLEYGEDNERYRAYNEIRMRIVRKLGPMPASADIAPTPLERAAVSPQDGEFRQHVQVVLSQVAGNLTPKARKMIEARREALGVTPPAAAAILEEIQTRYAPPAGKAADRYRAAVRDALELGGGEISEDCRLELIGLQSAVGMDADDATDIERSLRAKMNLS